MKEQSAETNNYCSYKDRMLDPVEKQRIDVCFSFIEDRFKQFNLPNFFMDVPFEDIEKADFSHLTQNQMKEILNEWAKLIGKAIVISFKVEVSLEYKVCDKIISIVKEKLPNLIKESEKLKQELARDFTNNSNSNPIFSDLFKFSDFKKMFESIFDLNKINEKTLDIFKTEKVFQYIRRKVIAEKANFHKLLENNGGSNVILLREVQQVNPSIAKLLANEFYATYCANNLNLTFPYGKESNTILINPAHALANRFKISQTEIGIFTLSLSPIFDLKRNVNDYFYHQKLTFEVIHKQESSMVELFYPIKIDNNTTFNLQVPVYFSFIRCKLIREQRNGDEKTRAA